MLLTRRLAHTFTLAINGDPTVFRLASFLMDEGLSEPFLLKATVLSRNPNIVFDDIIGQTALLTIIDEGGLTVGPRYVHGVVSSMAQATATSDGIKGFSSYEVVIEPQMALMRLTSDCRIFQQRSVREIVDQVLAENGVIHVRWTATGGQTPREFCCQYQETDLEFVERLLAEEGIWYCFDHSDTAHTLTLCDANDGGLPGPEIQMLYNGASGGNFDHACVTGFTVSKATGPLRAVQRDFTFKTPHTELETCYARANDPQRELFYYPGRYKDTDIGEHYTRLWLEEQRRTLLQGQGTSNIHTLNAGARAAITDHSASGNGQYLVIAVRHNGSQPQVAEEEAGGGASSYGNHFTVIPVSVPFRPGRRVKPKIEGLQTAMVVGPPGEEIYTDEFGRVKVQFPWDRYGQHDEHASCWIRVATNWAGIRWGHVALPRIGDEVLVEHLEGDIDQPIITGRAYNALNMQPYTLPNFKTRMTIQSKTHKGNGYNELRFEDERGEEEVYFQAEKYHNAWVKDNETWLIGGNRHKRVNASQSESIGGDKDAEVGGNHREVIGGSRNALIEGSRVTEIKIADYLKVLGNRISHIFRSLIQRVDEDYRLETGGRQHLKAGTTFYVDVGDTAVINAGSEICFNVGGNFVRINGKGVQIEGTMVKVNCGGSATKGKEVEAQAVIDPEPYAGPHAERYARSFEA